MHVLITGIAGFVGSRLARHLLARGDRVSGTYINSRPAMEGTDLYEANLLDPQALKEALQATDPEVIVHLGGLAHIGESWDWKKMPDYFRVNVEGTRNVLMAAEGRRVVIASSADVYGAVPKKEQPIPEHRCLAPQTPYALTKAAAEQLALDRNAVIVRSFNLIGPGQAPKFALASWARQLAAIRRRERRAVLKVGDLSTWRDFVHVDDGAAAYRLLAREESPAGIYNLASGKAVQMRDVMNRLLRISGVKAKVKEGFYPPRPHDIRRLSGDASRLRALGWTPERTLDDALSDLWKTVE